MALFNTAKIQLKKTFFLLLAFTLYPLLIFFGLAGYFLEKHHFEKTVLTELKTVEKLISHQGELHSRELQSLITHYINDAALQKAFLSQSRPELYKNALPYFQTILGQDISHFYLINLDKTCFLRVHNPERYGDLINRYTTQEAARTGHMAAGLEMGPYGTFTLRVVQPWYVDGKLIGYIELGRDIKNLTGSLKDILGMELFVQINKRHLDRQKWEEGLWMTGRTGNWDEDKKHIIFDRTMPELPKELGKYLDLPHEAKVGLMFRVKMGNSTYRGGFLPLRDARGKELGEIIALRDCTEELSSRTMLILFVLGSAGVSILIFALFYAYTTNLEGQLQHTYADLHTEIETRRIAEKKLQAHEEELELLVKERTTRLEQTNSQLQQEIQERIKISEELLKSQRLESIGVLAGGIAHDFNNLLTVILGNINLATLDKDLSADSKSLLQAAENASRQAKTLTQQLITFSDGGTPFTGVVDIVELTKRVVNALLPNTMTCTYNIQSDLWLAKADKTQLEQVIYNLVDNACTAMNNQGTIEISCSNQDYDEQQTLSQSDAHKFVKISIKDNGCGIPEKNLPKIFDPYFSTKDKSSRKGSGLGLAIAHSILTKHEGFIRVVSQEGKGSTFSLYLPAFFNA
ncbi:MAG: ATP-binding protein [Proteobacteria bacterium]|nr:ATP-binding protein [Pseudomonadota bacterium]MBU1638923.1 ATP-binding protein [Pseudomonadota bacterium]